MRPKKVAEKKAKKIAENMVYENEELDEERQLFCIYYLKYFNQVKALLKVRPDYRYDSACVIANRMMKEEAVQKEIKRLKKEMLLELFFQHFSLRTTKDIQSLKYMTFKKINILSKVVHLYLKKKI